MRRPVAVAPPKGKLGILTPGMGAVSTTFMAGVELVRRGHSVPVGSLTQMGTIRLGKRTDGRTPKIKDFVKLAQLEDLVFGGWDVFPDDAYQAALKAGVLEDGQLFYPDSGTPQGGVISPCLANVFLHHVLDEWFAAEVQPRLRGPSTLVRFADDFVVILAHKDDAERVMRVLEKRLGKYGLELHPDKTRMIDFRFQPESGHDDDQKPLTTTFNFLGFTHVWVTSEKGRAMVRQFTAKDRVARTLKTINRVCRSMRTWPLRDQHQRLCRMLKGHYAYFGISGNYERLATLQYQVVRIWRKWLKGGYREGRTNALCHGLPLREYSNYFRYRNHGLSIATPNRERICSMKNRMP